MLEPFGPNVVSLDGARWRFHLGITLPPFTADNVLGLIWDETLRQVDIMAASWSHSGAKASLKHNVYSLTMNTMSLVGFGKRSEGAEVSGAVPRGHTLSLVESIQSVVLHLPHIMLLPHWALKQVASKAHQGYSELEMYMTELIKQEKTRLDSGVAENKSNRATLLTAVLDANTQKVGRDMLTDTEIKGNIFMFLLAGYDTTANTILFCTITLALYPSIQAQVINEVDLVWKKAEMAGRTELSLAHDMPRFRYLIAFMVCTCTHFHLFVGDVTGQAAVASNGHLQYGNSTRSCASSLLYYPSPASLQDPKVCTLEPTTIGYLRKPTSLSTTRPFTTTRPTGSARVSSSPGGGWLATRTVLIPPSSGHLRR